jgi:hypothetical protein
MLKKFEFIHRTKALAYLDGLLCGVFLGWLVRKILDAR